MSTVIELLYEYWIGLPDPNKWPEALRDNPVKGHSQYAFHEGLCLGFLLAVEALYPETQ